MRIFVWAAIGVSVFVWLLSTHHGHADDQEQRVIPGWGEVVDPAGDCTIEEAAGTLTITVPGKEHNLNPLPGWNNLDAPRVLRDVDGDFVLQVLVRKFDMPKAETSSNKEKPASFVAGGLLVWKDGKNFLRDFARPMVSEPTSLCLPSSIPMVKRSLPEGPPKVATKTPICGYRAKRER